MASDADRRANMVLRTVYLPITMDNELRHRAFEWNRSKNELIRGCVRVALEHHADELFALLEEEKEPAAALAQAAPAVYAR